MFADVSPEPVQDKKKNQVWATNNLKCESNHMNGMINPAYILPTKERTESTNIIHADFTFACQLQTLNLSASNSEGNSSQQNQVKTKSEP